MKTKKFEKKLVLNKKTIATINNGDLSIVKGGISGGALSCDSPSCYYTQPCWVTCGEVTNCCAHPQTN